MEIVWVLLLFAAAVVLDFVLLVRAKRYERALRIAERNIAVLDTDISVLTAVRATYEQSVKDYQATIVQYQQTMEQMGGQLKAAGIGIESRDHIIQQQAVALHDINNVINGLYTLFTSDEDREMLNDAWRGWHARNHNNLTGIVL